MDIGVTGVFPPYLEPRVIGVGELAFLICQALLFVGCENLVFFESARSYAKNFSTALGFALLLVFVLPFVLLSNAFVSSGTVLIDYGFLSDLNLELVLLGVFTLLFLYFYSLFVCLMVFAVRKDLANVRIMSFLDDKINKSAFKYFRFLAAFTFIAAILSYVLVLQGVPIELINAVLFLVSVSFMFLAQTIVVDEESLGSSIARNWEYILKAPAGFFLILGLGLASLFALQLLEFVIDYFFLVGNFVSLFIALIVLVPFFEVLKTRLYMKRFEIIRSYHSRVEA